MTTDEKGVSRRDFLKFGGLGVAGLATTATLANFDPKAQAAVPSAQSEEHDHGESGTVGEVDHDANEFDPHEILTDFDYGTVTEEDGQVIRTWQIVAIDKEFEIAPGVFSWLGLWERHVSCLTKTWQGRGTMSRPHHALC